MTVNHAFKEHIRLHSRLTGEGYKKTKGKLEGFRDSPSLSNIFTDEDAELFRKSVYSNDKGAILFTGPSGSGRTTARVSGLAYLAKSEFNHVVSISDDEAELELYSRMNSVNEYGGKYTQMMTNPSFERMSVYSEAELFHSANKFEEAKMSKSELLRNSMRMSANVLSVNEISSPEVAKGFWSSMNATDALHISSVHSFDLISLFPRAYVSSIMRSQVKCIVQHRRITAFNSYFYLSAVLPVNETIEDTLKNGSEADIEEEFSAQGYVTIDGKLQRLVAKGILGPSPKDNDPKGYSIFK